MRKFLLLLSILICSFHSVSISQIIPTNEWVSFYSSNTVYDGSPILVGSTVDAYDPDSVYCGTFTVTTQGHYGFLQVYRDDFTTPGVDEGAEPGDTITFKIDGVYTITLGPETPVWTSNGATIEVNLDGRSNWVPVVTDIPDQTVPEGGSFTTISLDDYVSDPDNSDNQMSWTYTGSTDLTVTINASRVATIGIPNSNWNGSETLTFKATDPGGLSDSSDATFTVTGEFTQNIMAGWNMISLPLIVSASYYLTLFPNALESTLFGFNGTYYVTDTLYLCSGYWLRFPSAESVLIQGFDNDSCIIDLMEGWNLISCSSCDVAFVDISDPGGIIVPGTLFGFNGVYYSADTLGQGNAYWIRANALGTITISCGAPLAKGGNDLTLPLETLNGFGKIEISDNTNSSQTLYFNGKLDENISIESYSMPPVSPKGSFDARITGDYRLSESEEVLVEIQSSSYPLKVKIEGKGKQYIVKQLIGTNEIDERIVASGEEITISNSKVNKLRILKGSLIPTEFVLHQNYPNPFNPITKIKYGIPNTENVELAIFNVLGERIVTLVNEEQEAGYYTVEWSGNNVSSGVYLYTLKAGDNFDVKKMILLR